MAEATTAAAEVQQERITFTGKLVESDDDVRVSRDVIVV